MFDNISQGSHPTADTNVMFDKTSQGSDSTADTNVMFDNISGKTNKDIEVTKNT